MRNPNGMSSLWSLDSSQAWKISKRLQRYKCPQCNQTFPEHLNTIYYNRHLSSDEVHTILQSHAEGSSLRGISRISGRAYGTVVSLIRDASQKAEIVHNAEVKQVKTEAIIADEMSITDTLNDVPKGIP